MSEPAAEAGPALSERRQALAEQREARLNPEAGVTGGIAAGGGGTGWQKKLGPLPVWAWFAIGVGGLALGWYIYKSKKASSSASTAASASTSSGLCMDAAGQQVPCSQVDYGGQIATLQTEIMDLQGASASAPAPASSSTSSGNTVTGLSASPSATSVKLSWGAPGPGTWSYVITYSAGTQGKSGYAVGPELTTGNTSYTVSPLKSKTAYLFNVQAQQEGNPQLGPMTSVSATTT